jgi:phosphoribosylformylglycinamidine synthase
MCVKPSRRNCEQIKVTLHYFCWILGNGKNRLGASALAQVFGQIGHEAPDLDQPQQLAIFFALIQAALEQNLLLAYHDRSDGGLFVTIAEMAFAGHCGVDIAIGTSG